MTKSNNIKVSSEVNAMLEKLRSDLLIESGMWLKKKEDIIIYLLKEKGYYNV